MVMCLSGWDHIYDLATILNADSVVTFNRTGDHCLFSALNVFFPFGNVREGYQLGWERRMIDMFNKQNLPSKILANMVKSQCLCRKNADGACCFFGGISARV